MGAARAVEAIRAVMATAFKENFIVEDGEVVERVEGGGRRWKGRRMRCE